MKKSSIRGNFTGRENARKRAAKKRRKQREAKRRKLLRQQKRMQQPTKKKVVKLLRSIDWSLIPVIGKWIFQIALTILIAFVCVWYFGQRVSVVGDSMKPVLENGDIVLANRIVYNASKPKRGDVIILSGSLLFQERAWRLSKIQSTSMVKSCKKIMRLPRLMM